MSFRDVYHKKALECLAAAEHMIDHAPRAIMIHIAQNYFKLADYVQTHHERGTAHRREREAEQHPDS